MCASRTVVLFRNIVCNIKENVAHAKSTYKKNVLELVVGVLREKTSWRMLKVRTQELSLLVVFFFDYYGNVIVIYLFISKGYYSDLNN